MEPALIDRHVSSAGVTRQGCRSGASLVRNPGPDSKADQVWHYPGVIDQQAAMIALRKSG